MLRDRYGFDLTTASSEARDAYVAGVDLSLAANHGAEEQFRKAIACDEGLAVAHVALARTLQVRHKPDEARAAATRARELMPSLPHRERSHVNALAACVDSGSAAGFAAIKEHLAQYPRDAMVLAPCTGVFGLIGFSGRPGREAELLQFLESLAGAYGEDWWFTSALAFAQVEVGEIDRARTTIDRSLAVHPRNANGAHIRAHVYYEAGEREAGLAYLTGWWRDYPKDSLLHCHISWHVALWELALGRPEQAWDVYRTHLRPGASTGPPINTLSDCASFLLRAEMAGEARDPELWRELSEYATLWFPSPGVAFADVHGALAHAFAGDAEALARVIAGAKGPARDVVAPLAQAFGHLSASDWDGAAAGLRSVLDSHERIGGSRAQRDLIEYALVVCLLRSGRGAEARSLLESRRRQSGAGGWPIKGL
ncbi:MAG TPA: tetratricopeptide repeat protein [Hyphomicrobiaceae bacterium]|nr:tetratricopeptide repeat protein [Hyphomicrobiaceae bacterium]